MATIPVYSPTIPFLGLVPGGLRPGSMVRIKGVVNNHGERCQINVQTGAALNPRDDVVLHLSIRPNEAVIVRNTLQNQVWGAEERYGGCPIAYGQQFDVLVLAEVNQWKIAINGNHFCTFSHRLPVHSARYVSISGGCVIHSITAEMDTGAAGAAGGAAPPYPGTVPGGPHPPPYVPPYVPPHGGPSIGFAPVPPPMPPPPPYTPTPGYPNRPIGGSGLYPGGPPYPGYPHQTGYPAAVSYSPTPSAPAAAASGAAAVGVITSPSQPQTMKQTLIGGIQKTKDFLHDAVGGGGGAKVKPMATATVTPLYPNLPAVPGNPYPASSYPNQIPVATPYPGTAAYGNIQHQPSAPPSAGASNVGLLSAAAASGAVASVLHNLPVRDVRKEKGTKH